jgi:hypothetical protein
MDLVGACGTIRIVRLLVTILTFAFVVIAGSRAEAQVFKPRGKSASTKAAKKPDKDTAPAAEKEKPAKKAARSTDSPKRATASKTKPASKKSTAAESGRPSDLTPATEKTEKGSKKGSKKGRKSEIDDDEVATSSSGDDDVIIIDDDD